ncbi:MAG: UbiH/UbiF/VisC/COQ6 family ubiquinone biosynthesis hydroxylase [Alphaproteobacteria bacterium]
MLSSYPVTESSRYDVAISGGGFAGMTLAIALAQDGLQVLLIEKGAISDQLAPAFDGRVSAIALGSQRILDSVGAWRAMATHAEPIRDIRVSDGDTPFFLHYDHNEIRSQTNGAPFGYIVENRYIRHALVQRLQHENITLAQHCSVSSITSDATGVHITLSDGRQTQAALLVGADGKFSSIRSMAGIKDIRASYRQTAIVCTICHEHPHEGLAQERFLPAGPFAVLPMTGNRSSLVWVEPDDRVQLYMDLPDDEFVQEITERTGNYLGTISVEGKRFCYPLTLVHANQYVQGRIVLAGDAAHAIHPIAGQGVNLGFRDVGVLAELLSRQHRLGLDIGAPAVLQHYQRWRRFDNFTMLAVTDTLTRLFSNTLLPLRLARGVGMWAVGQTKPLKRFFMLHAMGLTGDIPAMAKQRSGTNPHD